ncbi:hypothetical protein [Persicitalea sp.]|uniref:hypothetical protein n=1 Tax=Persicitalea sp. TaxID=3100273 RepID=UPI003593EDC5
MKTKNLLPNRWKPMGWVLLVLFIPVGFWSLISDEDFPIQAQITIPWPFGDPYSLSGTVSNGGSDFSGSTTLNENTTGEATLNLIDEIISLAIMIGLFLTGFAQVKNEDERTAQMRLGALQWAIYGNTLVLVLCIMFVHGLPFLNIMIYNMFTPLLIFVLRFHWLLYKEAREIRQNESRILAL